MQEPDRDEVREEVAEPFGVTSNPAAYVPRDASEIALAALARAVDGEGASDGEEGAGAVRLAALTGPPGIGKSLLLRLLARRVATRLQAVFLAYGALETGELWRWAWGLLGRPPVDDPRGALLDHAARLRREGSALVLLVDDADAMPLATGRALVETLERSGGGLRAVLAVADDGRAGRLMAALGPALVEVPFKQRMSPAETRAYVDARLEMTGAPRWQRARFDEAALERIHRLSGGIPRRVHEVARAVLGEQPAGAHHPLPEERWMGAPLDHLDGDDGAAGAAGAGELEAGEEEGEGEDVASRESGLEER